MTSCPTRKGRFPEVCSNPVHFGEPARASETKGKTMTREEHTGAAEEYLKEATFHISYAGKQAYALLAMAHMELAKLLPTADAQVQR